MPVVLRWGRGSLSGARLGVALWRPPPTPLRAARGGASAVTPYNITPAPTRTPGRPLLFPTAVVASPPGSPWRSPPPGSPPPGSLASSAFAAESATALRHRRRHPARPVGLPVREAAVDVAPHRHLERLKRRSLPEHRAVVGVRWADVSGAVLFGGGTSWTPCFPPGPGVPIRRSRRRRRPPASCLQGGRRRRAA